MRFQLDKAMYYRDNTPPQDALVAQLDRVPGYEPGGRGFDSLPARHYTYLLLIFLASERLYRMLFFEGQEVTTIKGAVSHETAPLYCLIAHCVI